MSEWANRSDGEIVESHKLKDIRKIKTTDGKRVLLEMDENELEEGGYEVYIRKRSLNSPNLSRMPWQFTMVNYEYIPEFIDKCNPKLSNRDIALMFMLGTSYINFDGVVVNRESGVYMSVAEIADAMKWTTRTVMSSLAVLESNNALSRFECGRNTFVRMNPILFYRGQSNNYGEQLKKVRRRKYGIK